MRLPRRATWIVGLVLLVGAPVGWELSRPAVDIGKPPTPDLTLSPSEPQNTGRLGPDPSAPDDAPPPAPATATAPAEQAAPPFSSTAPRGAIDASLWPTAVQIAAIGVAAPVITVGVGSEGELVIPESVLDVGWYQGSAVPGEPGVALLTSHLDTRTQGRGVFAGLTTLEVGSAIELRDSSDATTRWRVVAREQRLKTDLPPQLFARNGPPILALVTCGGPFDQAARSYRDNIIVWAELVG
jgi:sortase (surface protein transpeptidase)